MAGVVVGCEPVSAPLQPEEPVEAAGPLTFRSISAGASHTCGVTTSGVVHCWGADDSGQLGDGALADVSATRRPNPVPVAGGLTFTSVTAGVDHSCAVAMDGAAWCWGCRRARRCI